MMKIIDRDNFKMFVQIGQCKSPRDMKVIHFIREEYDKQEDLILRNNYEFFMTKDEMRTLAKVLNEHEE